MNSLSEQSVLMFAEATGYLTTLERSLKRKSKFNNDLLYNIISLCTEKLFMALLSFRQVNASHHTPMALYNEAEKLKPMPVHFRETLKLVARYESICMFDAFGYKTPDDESMKCMIIGLKDIHDYVQQECAQ